MRGSVFRTTLALQNINETTTKITTFSSQQFRLHTADQQNLISTGIFPEMRAMHYFWDNPQNLRNFEEIRTLS